MKTDIYSEKGIKLTTKADLPDAVFAIKPHEAATRQYVRVYEVNQRVGTAATKTRGEVSGGGRKPWAQKGTGRARHGSIRSPIWVGGGATFGPQPRTFELSVPKKVRDLALKSALSWKSEAEKIFVVEEFAPKEPKTKLAAELLAKLGLEKPLIVVPSYDEKVLRSFRNIPGVWVKDASSVNPFDVLSAKSVLIFKGAIAVLSKRLGAEGKVEEPKKKPGAKKVAPAKPKKTSKPAAKPQVKAKKTTVKKKTAAKRAIAKRSTK